jgi:hypothetical protein
VDQERIVSDAYRLWASSSEKSVSEACAFYDGFAAGWKAFAESCPDGGFLDGWSASAKDALEAYRASFAQAEGRQ